MTTLFEPAEYESHYFVARTPLLSDNERSAWEQGCRAADLISHPDAALFERAIEDDRRSLRAGLRHVVKLPEVREALFLASTSLEQSLATWLTQPDGAWGRKIESALHRYFVRMSGRPTPFGLFSGLTVGDIGFPTRLSLAPRKNYTRHSRLDGAYLFQLSRAVAKELTATDHLRYTPNTSMSLVGNRLQYVSTSRTGAGYSFESVDRSPYLDTVIDAARGGATVSALAIRLHAFDPEIDLDEAGAYIRELVDCQVLVDDLVPTLTGPEPAQTLLERLAPLPVATAKEHLSSALQLLAELDAAPLGSALHLYEGISTSVGATSASQDARALGSSQSPNHLLQVDMYKPAQDFRLSPLVVAEVKKCLASLAAISPPSTDELERFRAEFLERYGLAEVPLAEVLDQELGISEAHEANSGRVDQPLLAGLNLAQNGVGSGQGERWHPRFLHMIEAVSTLRARGADEWVLDESDLAALRVEQAFPLPDAFFVFGTLCATSAAEVDRGRFRFVLRAATGPSSVNLFGRFVHSTPGLEPRVLRDIEAEERCRPDTIFAEIVHVPQERVANIACRPVLRAYEIPFLGRSGASVERQITLDDLSVSVRSERVVLRSRSLKREILVRLTSAHNFRSPGALPVYRFLCSLMHQQVKVITSWHWGPLWALPTLPRVSLGKCVISPKYWTIRDSDLAMLRDARGSGGAFRAIAELRRRREIPAHVGLVDGSNTLPLNLLNVMNVDLVATLAKKATAIRFVELLPGPDEMCVAGPEGRFVSEIHLPLVRRTPRSSVLESVGHEAPSPAPDRDQFPRRFEPASEWLYIKVYCGVMTADRVLREVVCRWLHEIGPTNAMRKWFFVRYRDPRYHLRLRLNGDPRWLLEKALPAFYTLASDFCKVGLIHRVQIDTYERELERYGGPARLAYAEELFRIDSDACLALLSADFSRSDLQEARWRMALLGADRWLTHFRYSLNERLLFSRRLESAFAREFDVRGTMDRRLGERFRRLRPELEALLWDSGSQSSSPPPWMRILDRMFGACEAAMAEQFPGSRTAGNPPFAVDEFASSVIHMHVNRLMMSEPRQHEMVLYSFLRRLYEARTARDRRRGASSDRLRASGGSRTVDGDENGAGD